MSNRVDIMTVMQQIDGLIGARRVVDAEKLAQQLIHSSPSFEGGWLQCGRIAQMKGDLQGMLSCAQKVIELKPEFSMGYLMCAEAQMNNAQVDKAIKTLGKLESVAASDALSQQQIGQFYTRMEDHEGAYRVYSRAVELAPNDSQALYNLSTAASSLGKMTEAEELLDKVIAIKPNDYDAYYNRATLRKQTLDNNHIDALEAVIKGCTDQQGLAQVGYALSKELEDIGEYDRSIAHLITGATARRKGLSYDVQGDVDTMQAIAKVHDADFCTDIQSSDEAGPVFILGLPRSGTTLVDRILSSHSAVESLGEVNDFVMSFMKAAGPAKDKMDLLEKSKALDFVALGEAYLASTAARGITAPMLIDKTPANFLYIGLIAKALPNAKIIHLKRSPMDSCYAMYKTLFRMGYPFSYDMNDLAEYYAAYAKLMDHWHAVFPGRIHDVTYSDLVADQETQSRSLVAACGLKWEEGCLSFHENSAPSATASAAQVRQPIYSSSVEKWRNYATALAPLQNALEAYGINVKVDD